MRRWEWFLVNDTPLQTTQINVCNATLSRVSPVASIIWSKLLWIYPWCVQWIFSPRVRLNDSMRFLANSPRRVTLVNNRATICSCTLKILKTWPFIEIIEPKSFACSLTINPSVWSTKLLVKKYFNVRKSWIEIEWGLTWRAKKQHFNLRTQENKAN